MAIIKLGATVVGIRGKLGGIVFSANGATPYAKVWQMPRAQSTSKQTTYRGRLSQYPQNWRDLTQAQRNDWDTYAAAAAQELTNPLGETYYASGFNWFCKLSQQRQTVGRTPPTTAPTAAGPPAPTISTFTLRPTGDAEESNVTVPAGTFSAFWDGVLAIALFSRQSPISATLPYPLTTYWAPSTATTYEFQDALEEQYGPITTDMRGFAALYKQEVFWSQRSTAATDYSDVEDS